MSEIEKINLHLEDGSHQQNQEKKMSSFLLKNIPHINNEYNT